MIAALYQNWRDKFRTLFQAGLISAFSLLLVLCVFEAGLRFYYPHRTLNTLIQKNSRIGYEHLPNVSTSHIVEGRAVGIHTNNWGFRQPNDISRLNAPKEVRILVSGDSFVFGWGLEYEETFFALLQEKARQKFPGEELTFINAGHGGYGTEQMIGLIEDKGFSLNPDAIFLLMGHNDIEDNARVDDIFIGKGGTLTRNDRPRTVNLNRSQFASIFPFYDWLIFNSYLMQIVRPAIRSLGGIGGTFKFGKSAPVLSEKPLEDTSVEERTVKLFEYLNARTQEKGITLTVSNVGVGTPRTRSFFGGMAETLNRKQVRYRDMSVGWKKIEKASRERLYLSDEHFSATGSKRFADLVSPALFELIDETLRRRSSR